MKKLHSKKTLQLSRETVRALDPDRLEHAAGAGDPSVRYTWCCPASYFTCPMTELNCSRACPQ